MKRSCINLILEIVEKCWRWSFKVSVYFLVVYCFLKV